jgi:hypothetical protein
LVRFDPSKDVPVAPLEVVSVFDMEDGCWELFVTRADLDAWLTWRTTPRPDAKPKVVKMKKDTMQ